VISRADRRVAAIDRAAFASKNRYTAANYALRQACILQGVRLSYPEMHQRMKGHDAYQALPAQVAQQVLRVLDRPWTAPGPPLDRPWTAPGPPLDRPWTAFFAALDAWKADPSQFLGRPRLPGYKDKQKGRTLLVYTIQALSRPARRTAMVCPSMLGITVRTRQQNVQQVHSIPRIGFYASASMHRLLCIGFYVVEGIYQREPAPAAVTPALHAGVDMGLNNLAVLTADQPGVVPRAVNGRPGKSINHFSNKRRAELPSWLGDGGTRRRLERITTRRTRRRDW